MSKTKMINKQLKDFLNDTLLDLAFVSGYGLVLLFIISINH